MDLDPACCLLYKTADRLWLSYHTVSAEDMRQAARWTQEEILNMDADRIDIFALTKWEAPRPVASNAPSHSKIFAAKLVPSWSGLDTGPTVSAIVQSLARALPATSRLVRPSMQPSTPVCPHPPPQQLLAIEAARMALPPLPPPRRLANKPTQALKHAAAPHPPSQQLAPAPTETLVDAAMPQSPLEQQGAHQQTTPLPSLLQASEPIEDPPAAAVAPAISAMSYLPTATPPPLMVTIGKLTAERLHDVDQESVQLPCDMVPSAHYVVDALGRSGTKSHNYVLSQWGHVSIGGKGKKVAWNAFAILDAFGQKAPPLHAAKDLVDNVMAAVTQAGHVVKIPEGANSEEVTCALQLSFVEALPQAMAAGFDASSRQMKASSSSPKQQGSMATLALVCGHHLTVATAGTSQAHLDTGSHIVLMSRLLTAEDSKPSAGIPSPNIRQVAIPKHGARLLMGSKAFWESIPFKQSVKGVRCKSSREAPTALQVVAIKEGAQKHPTIFVADFLPVGSGANNLNFQHLQKQKEEVRVFCPLNPTAANNITDWRGILAQRGSAAVAATEASQHLDDTPTFSLQAQGTPVIPTPGVAAVADCTSEDKVETETPHEGQRAQEQMPGGGSKTTNAAKKRAAKRRAQARRAEAGEQVLKQQEQLARLARRHRRQAPTTSDSSVDNARPSVPANMTNDQRLNMTAYIPKPTDQATDIVADKARLEEDRFSQPDQQQVAARQTSDTHDKGPGPNINEDSGRAKAPKPQDHRRQGESKALPRRTGASRAGRAFNTGEDRATGSCRGTASGSRGQASHQSRQGTLAATPDPLNQIQSGSTHIRPQALRQAQAAAARALSRPVPSTTGPSCSNAVLEHDGMESQSADTTQHQGPADIPSGPDTNCVSKAVNRLRPQYRFSCQHQQQQQRTQAVAARQARAAMSTNTRQHSSQRRGMTPVLVGGTNRHTTGSADGHVVSTRVDSYASVCEARRPPRA